MEPVKRSKGKAAIPQVRRPHPTHEKLVAATVDLMRDHLPEAISADMILEKSGVAKGSLYHHFNDLSDLVEVALTRSFSRVVDSNIAVMRDLLSKARTKEDFFQATVQFNILTQKPERRDARFERVRLLGLAYKNPRFSARLAAEQQRLTEAYADLFRFAQSKGWMDSDFDPRAAAVLIQAYTLGKAVDDVVADPVAEEAWNSIIIKIVTHAFGVVPV